MPRRKKKPPKYAYDRDRNLVTVGDVILLGFYPEHDENAEEKSA